ncbi:MAG: peroxiredoxin [Candidatus Thermoplasmatota archaeon]|nr:peroxiredoxin [Candidatus Thermoplasmatota archaeon]
MTGRLLFLLSASRAGEIQCRYTTYPDGYNIDVCDPTSGCTLEGQEFRDLYPDFAKANTIVVGISRDSIKSHEGFKAAHGFPFELLSDKDETVCELFGVMKLKNMYGKQVRGVERSTFVFDVKGKLVKSWRGLKAPGHAVEVLGFVQGVVNA